MITLKRNHYIISNNDATMYQCVGINVNIGMLKHMINKNFTRNAQTDKIIYIPSRENNEI